MWIECSGLLNQDNIKLESNAIIMAVTKNSRPFLKPARKRTEKSIYGPSPHLKTLGPTHRRSYYARLQPISVVVVVVVHAIFINSIGRTGHLCYSQQTCYGRRISITIHIKPETSKYRNHPSSTYGWCVWFIAFL